MNENVELIYPDQGKEQIGTFLIPNTVTLIKGGHHPQNARKLIDYLLSRDTQKKLAFSPCAQTPLLSGMDVPAHVRRIDSFKYMPVNYSAVRKKVEEIRPLLKDWYGQ